MKKPYNGHESWTAWNVSLWVANEEPTYRRAVELLNKYSVRRSAHILSTELPARTPDGARYSIHALTLALKDLKD